jgi:glutamate racemase
LLGQSDSIDTILLACTHYPLLMDKIKANIPAGIKVISQGEIVADSLSDYLSRHSEIENKLSKNGGRDFCTTDSSSDFDRQAKKFYGTAVASVQVHL